MGNKNMLENPEFWTIDKNIQKLSTLAIQLYSHNSHAFITPIIRHFTPIIL